MYRYIDDSFNYCHILTANPCLFLLFAKNLPQIVDNFLNWCLCHIRDWVTWPTGLQAIPHLLVLPRLFTYLKYLPQNVSCTSVLSEISPITPLSHCLPEGDRSGRPAACLATANHTMHGADWSLVEFLSQPGCLQSQMTHCINALRESCSIGKLSFHKNWNGIFEIFFLFVTARKWFN